MPKIKIGLCQRSLALSLKQTLVEAQKLEVSGVELDAWGELAPRNLTDTARRHVRHLLSSYDLQLSAMYCPLRRGLDVPEDQEIRLEYIKEAMTLSFELGSRIVVLNPGKISEKPEDPRTQWLADALLALGRHGDRIGCLVALETGFDSAETVTGYLAKVDVGSLKVNYNPGNLLIHGHNPYQSLRIFQHWIAHAHAKDARSSSPSRAAQEVPLGHGDLDWLQLAGAFAEIEYLGYLAIEREGSPNFLAELPRAVDFLKRMF